MYCEQPGSRTLHPTPVPEVGLAVFAASAGRARLVSPGPLRPHLPCITVGEPTSIGGGHIKRWGIEGMRVRTSDRFGRGRGELVRYHQLPVG